MRSLTNKRIREPLEMHGEYTIYTEIERFRSEVLRRSKKKYIYDTHRKILRISAGFDIETTRIETRTYMYHWQFSFGKSILTGRKWSDFVQLVEILNKWLAWQKAIIIVWVANLGYEFSFMCSRFSWKSVFAVDAHEPLKARTDRVEFRECLSISGQGGLQNLAKNYTRTQKAKGDLDFTKIRNSMTPLDDTERGYTWADVEILSEWGDYIWDNFADKGLQIPLTATGIVRSHIKAAAEETGRYEEIRQIIQGFFPQDRRQYNYIMQYLFRGGYTHANVWYVDCIEDDVIGADYTSSYPAVMLHNDCYQRSPFKQIELQHDGHHITDHRLQDMCCWMVVRFYDIKRTTYHSIESRHKLAAERGAKFDNGRLTSADMIEVALTELDYAVYEKFYEWSRLEVVDANAAAKGKLPEYVLKPLRHFYEIKSRLKAAGLDGTVEYANAKAIVNSMYGCCVTRLKFMENKWDPESKLWKSVENKKDYDELRKRQILSPYWGIEITSAARFNILMSIWEIDGLESPDPEPAVLYSDTDSLYGKDSKRLREIIAKLNEKTAAMNADLPPEFADLGCFDWIGKDKQGEPYRYRFKTLGAKRYLKWCPQKGAECTVAGLPKHALENLIAKPFGSENSYILYEDPKHKKGRIGFVDVDELFDMFRDNMFLACDYSEKSRALYYPNQHDPWDGMRTDIVTDEYGNTEEMGEYTYVTILPVAFKLKMDRVFMELVNEVLKERRMPV